MYLTKYEIAVEDGTTETSYYSSLPVNGLIHAIQYTVDTTYPVKSTAAFTICREDATTETWGRFLSGVSASTNNWYYMPRYKVADSTAASSAWNSTTYVPDYYAITGERIEVILAGATSDGQAGTITVWVQGGA